MKTLGKILFTMAFGLFIGLIIVPAMIVGWIIDAFGSKKSRYYYEP